MGRLGTDRLGTTTLGATDKTIQAPATNLTLSTPNPAITGGAVNLSVPETGLVLSTPNPGLTSFQRISAPTTELNLNTVNPNVAGGATSFSVPTTELTLTSNNPQVEPGVVNINAETTTLNLVTPSPDASGGPTSFSAPVTELNLVSNNVEIRLSDLVLAGDSFATILTPDKNALITTKNKFVNMTQHTFKEGDLGDVLEAQLKDDDGAIDLSNAVQQVDIVMQNREGTTVLDSQVTISNATEGRIKYEWQSGDPIETAGVYRTEFRIINGDGSEDTVPNDDYVTIEVEEELG